MIHSHRFLSCFLVVAFSLWLFNACSGAASKRAEILRSTGGGLEIAPDISDEEVDEAINDTSNSEEEAAPDDPTEFNYFPYDLQLDTIAYMGCENANSFFTVKAGAYFKRSGLRLSEYFLRKTSSMSQSALKDLIESSTKHQAFPYLSIAYKHNLTSVFKISGLTAAKQFSMLRLPRLIEDLINTGNTRLREPTGDTIEAQFSYGLGGAKSIARSFSENWRLLLSYKGGKENKTLHQTDGDWGIDVYGRVYSISLNKIKTAAQGVSRYALSSVSEEKRPQAPPQTEWTCPESLRFEIRRHPETAYKAQKHYDTASDKYKEQYTTVQEAINNDPKKVIQPDEPICVSSSSRGTAFTVTEAVLGEDWNINISKKCISLKDPDDYCYEITNQNNVSYRLAKADSSDCGRQTNNYCPHFLSICIRKN